MLSECFYLPPWQKRSDVFGSISLFVCEQHYSKGFERIVMKFHGDVGGSAKKKLIKS